jgi:multidrug efflux pump subunit AcrA (membrane-fusion protein)
MLYLLQARISSPALVMRMVRTMLSLALLGLPSVSWAEDAVKLSPEQVQGLAIRTVHPVFEIAVSPGQRVEQSAPLVKLGQLSPIWAEISIPASNVRAIRPGAQVEIDGYGTPGQVVSETTDAATQTILVRAEVPNTGELRPGQTAATRISFVSSGESAWEIPYSALIRRGEQASVFVAVEGGFRLVPVSLVAEDQDHVVVSGPITDRDEVAVSGISALRGILLRLGAG